MLTKQRHQPGTYYTAIAILVGAAIGAGIFGLPYVIYQSGFIVGLIYLLGLGVICTFINLIYGEIVLSTNGSHQLPYYAEKYLGQRWKWLTLITVFIGFYGALSAYLIEIGHLFKQIISPIISLSSIQCSLIYFVFIASALYIGLRAVASVDRIMMLVSFAIIIMFIVIGLPQLHFETLYQYNTQYLFWPYGIVLFALASAAAIPDVKNILIKNRLALKKTILIGSFIPVLIYIAFVAVTISICGANITENALIGLGQVLGKSVLIFGSVFGIITMTTSFLLLGLVLKETYIYDLKQPAYRAWLMVIIPPIGILLGNLLSFVELLGLTGGLLGGFEGIIIIRIHQKLSHQADRLAEYHITTAHWLHYLLYLVFICGIIYQFYMLYAR
ncbi:MAG: aromatic amino acid transport family protein [Patescibacteria group bacterium]|jgi:tyrosine-specific transport protein